MCTHTLWVPSFLVVFHLNKKCKTRVYGGSSWPAVGWIEPLVGAGGYIPPSRGQQCLTVNPKHIYLFRYKPRQVGGSFRASSAAPRKWRKVGNVSFQSLWANFHWRTKKILKQRSPWESKGLIHPLYSISFVDSHAGPGRVFISKVKSAARGRAGMPQPAEERVCVSPSSSYSSL